MANFVTKFLGKIFGSKYDRDVAEYTPVVEQINIEYSRLTGISNDELRNKTLIFRERIAEHLAGIDEDIKSVEVEATDTKDIFQKEELYKKIDELKESRDKHLLKPDFFNVEKYPVIVFKSQKIKKVNKSSFLLIGFLTLKGIKKEMQIPIKIIKTESELKIKGEFLINRKDFNVGGSSLVLSKTVKVLVIYVGNKS